MRQVLLLLVPAAAATLALATPITRLIYEHGEFGPARHRARGRAPSSGSPSACPTSGVNLLLTRTFFSLQRPWITTWIAALNLAVNVAVSVALYGPFGIPGIVVGTAAGSLAMTLAQAYALRRELHGRLEARETRSRWRACWWPRRRSAASPTAPWWALDDLLGRGLVAQVVVGRRRRWRGGDDVRGLVLALRIPEAEQISGWSPDGCVGTRRTARIAATRRGCSSSSVDARRYSRRDVGRRTAHASLADAPDAGERLPCRGRATRRGGGPPAQRLPRARRPPALPGRPGLLADARRHRADSGRHRPGLLQGREILVEDVRAQRGLPRGDPRRRGRAGRARPLRREGRRGPQRREPRAARDDALDAIRGSAAALGARIAELGGPPAESDAQRLVRHVAAMAALEDADEIIDHLLTSALDLVDLDSAMLLTVEAPPAA